MSNLNLVCDLSSGVCGEASGEMVEKINVAENKQKMKMTYFTDPICSACWALEPVMKKLSEEYGEHFSLEHRLGGLLKGWEGFRDSANGIGKPADVAHHWEQIGEWSGMPIDGDIWLEDPLESSYPSSRAVKAVELIDKRLAERYLRRIREMVFVEKKNIAKVEYLIQAAVDIGADKDLFYQKYLSPESQQLFEEDMQLSRAMNVRGFPTIVLQNDSGEGVMIRGIQQYEQYVSALRQVSGTSILPNVAAHSVLDIVNKFRFVSTKEVAELVNSDLSNVLNELERLTDLGQIQKVTVKTGYFWQANTIS